MKILAAIDLSNSTDKVVKEAQKYAQSMSAKVYFLHVAAPDPEFIGYDAGPQSVRDSVSNDFHEEHRQIQGIADDFRKVGLDATALLVQGATVETINAEAVKLGVDMIIVGSHGHGAMYQMLVGSISEGILRNCDVPVLVIPARKST